MDHKIQVKIYYEDTDCGGVVYYANYLRYLERSRTECLESMGLSLKNLKEQGIQFVVRHVDIEYLSSGKYGETLIIETKDIKIEGLRIIFNNVIKKEEDESILAKAKTTLICINDQFKPIRIPETIKEKLSLDQIG